MILKVYNNLLFDAMREEIACITPNIKKLMSTTLMLPGGVPPEVEVGKKWLRTH